MVDGTPSEVMSAAVHDVRSSVGSIRLAVTSVLAETVDDPDFRNMMLSDVEEETRRLDAALTALPALVEALTDGCDVASVKLDSVLRQAAADAARREIDVSVGDTSGVAVEGRAPSLQAVLAALMGLAADGGHPVVVSASPDDGDVGVRVRVARGDHAPMRSERTLVRSLITSIGATWIASEDAIELHLPARP